MKRSIASQGAMLVAGCLAVSSACAQPDASAQAFVGSLVEAINSGDIQHRKRLLHADSLNCRTAGQNAAIVQGFRRQSSRPIPETYRWSLKPIAAEQPMLLSDRYEYTVLPTHLLEIDYASGPQSSTILILQVAHTGEVWHEVAACPRSAPAATAH